MKKIVIAAILVLIHFQLFSQNQDLGKVTIEELKEKVCPTDTSAVAAYLFNVGKTYFEYSHDDGFEIVTEYSAKIKIYKKEGYSFANQSLKYYNNSGTFEKVNFSKAVTYNLVNGKIEKSKLNGEGEFDEKENKYWSKKKITLPNVKVGSIIEFKAEVRSPFTDNFPEWEFQKSIPVKYSTYSTFIPEYFIYNTHIKGFYNPVTTKDGKSRKIEDSYIQNAQPGINAGGAERINSSLEFREDITKYVLENVPALKEEAFVNNMDNYKASLLHELAATRYPNRPYENFTTDWESVVKKVYENQSFGEELKKSGYFEKDLDVLLTGITSNQDRMKMIFDYVKSRMNWNEFGGIYCDDGVKEAYKDKKGNIAEINLMLTAMLRYAGIEANPVLVSTRSNGISLYPSESSYNYVIVGVELENQMILLDATNKYSLPNILPIRDLNWFGRIIRKNGSSAVIDLMPKLNSKEIVNIMASVNEQGEVSGKIRNQKFDYKALVFRVNYAGITNDSHVEKLEKRYHGIGVGDYEVQNSSDLEKPIVENYSFTTTNEVEIIGDKMYVSPFLFFTLTENPFKQEKREYPIDFVYPNQMKFNISINFPEGYTVETLPQSRAVAMPENMGSFKYSISNNGNQIQLLYTADMNQAIIGSEDYEILKNYYKEMILKQTEKIVLKKG